VIDINEVHSNTKMFVTIMLRTGQHNKLRTETDEAFIRETTADNNKRISHLNLAPQRSVIEVIFCYSENTE